MKIVYRSYDGKEFNRAEDCIKYENEHPPIRMWDDSGKTKEIADCLVVEIETDKAAQDFCAISHEADMSYDGIDGPGLYFWNDWEERYDNVSNLYNLDALRRYLNDR